MRLTHTICFTLLVAAVAADVRAQPPSPNPPALLVLHLPLGPAAARTQEDLFAELSLVLDDFMIVRASAPSGFGTKTLAGQIAQVKPIVKRYEAVAAAWLDQPRPGLFMLHLIATRGDRTLIRSFEGGRRAGSAASLALEARELLGMAYLFDPAENEAPLREVVQEVRQHAEEVAQPGEPTTAYRLRVAAMMESGLVGHEGASTSAGVELAPEVSIADVGVIALGIRAHYGPVAAPRGTQITIAGLTPTLGVGRELKVGSATWIPMLRGIVSWRQTTIEPNGQRQTFQTLIPGVELSLDGRLRSSRSTQLSVQLTAGWWSRRSAFQRRSDGSAAIKTPQVFWGVAAGLVL